MDLRICENSWTLEPRNNSRKLRRRRTFSRGSRQNLKFGIECCSKTDCNKFKKSRTFCFPSSIFDSKLPVSMSVMTVLILCATPFSQALSAYGMPTVYLDGSGDNKCGGSSMERAVKEWSGFIYSHEPIYERYAGGKNCFLIIKAPEGYKIRLSVLDFYLVGDGGTNKDCPGDSLHVFDKDDTANNVGMEAGPGPIIGMYCGRQYNGTILAESKLNELTLWWHTDADLEKNHHGKGFRLLWTIFRPLPPKYGQCEEVSEFQCRNSECIPSQLACDRVPHCSDSSDLDFRLQRERGCTNLPEPPAIGTLGAAALAGICIGCVLGMVLICVVLSVCCREKCRNKQRSRHPHEVGGASNGYKQQTDHLTCAGSGSSPQRPPDLAHCQTQTHRHVYAGQNGAPHSREQTRQLMKQPFHGPGRGNHDSGYCCNGEVKRTFNV